MYKWLCFAVFLFLNALPSAGAGLQPLCVLYDAPHSHDTPPLLCPARIHQAQPSATFVIQFEGFTEEARLAFEYAAAIMEKVVVTSVPIEVKTRLFDPSISNILGGGTSDFVQGFPGAQPRVWYPSALADALTGEDQNPQSFDIEVLMNRNVRWYFGLDGNVPEGHTDFVSVILHELGHGLGFGSGMEVLEEGETDLSAAVGVVSYGWRTEPFPYFTLQLLNLGGSPILFDLFLVENFDRFLTDTVLFPNPSQALTEAATSGRVFFSGERSILSNKGERPLIFAPSPFANGSSLSHLDENRFNRGNPDALMTPSLQRGEVVHDLGTIFIGVLQDLGWSINPDILPMQSSASGWDGYQ